MLSAPFLKLKWFFIEKLHEFDKIIYYKSGITVNIMQAINYLIKVLGKQPFAKVFLCFSFAGHLDIFLNRDLQFPTKVG